MTTARRSKYGNQPVEINGIRFASKAEGKRWVELDLLRRAGQITNLIRQPRYPLTVAGIKVCTYVADFAYDEGSSQVVEDVKGVHTDVFRLKQKLFEALHPGLKITIVGKTRSG